MFRNISNTLLSVCKLSYALSRYSHTTAHNFDIVVSGSGMVGGTMAICLGCLPELSQKKILLVDAKLSEKRPLRSIPDSRTCALSCSTVELLDRMGIWSKVTDKRVQPIIRMQVWDGCTDSTISFQDNDMSPIAFMAENDVLQSAILDRLKELEDRIEVVEKEIASYSFPDHHLGFPSIRFKDFTEVNARLLIAADGANSLCRNTAKIKTYDHNYNQVGLVATLRLSEETENYVAWQRFLPSGPIAMLPIDNNHSCLVWTTSHGSAKELIAMDMESFVHSVNQAFWSNSMQNSIANAAVQALDSLILTVGLEGSSSCQVAPNIIGVEKNSRKMFPLALMHANNYVGDRMMLIGDAAHRMHPLAGQGANLGFGDISCFERVLQSSLKHGADVGSKFLLQDYETSRQRYVIPTVMAVHSLQKLYGTSLAPVVLMRSLGLQVCNSLWPVKSRILQHASKSI